MFLSTQTERVKKTVSRRITCKQPLAAEACLAAINYHASSTACAQAALFQHTHPRLQTKTGSIVHLQGVRAVLDHVPSLPCCVPAPPCEPESRRCCHNNLMRLPCMKMA